MWSKVERGEIIIIRGGGISVQEVSRGRLAGLSDAPRGTEIQARQGAEGRHVGGSRGKACGTKPVQYHRHPSVTQDAEQAEGNASPIKNHTPSWICISTLCFIPHNKVTGSASLSDGVQMEKMSYHRFLSHLIMGVECRGCRA